MKRTHFWKGAWYHEYNYLFYLGFGNLATLIHVPLKFVIVATKAHQICSLVPSFSIHGILKKTWKRGYLSCMIDLT